MPAVAQTSVTAPKRLLYGPGPTMVEPRVYEAMSQPVVGIKDPYFFEVIGDVRAGLRKVFGTTNPLTLAISGTGSSGMETAVANLIEPGTKFAVFASGYFCDRLAEMGRRHGAEVVRLEKPWGEVFTAAEAEEFIQRERPQVVAFVQAETSTGAYQSGKAISDAAKKVGAFVIADCVTSLGAMPVEVDKNGIDIAYSCTQKGLSCPPGLSPITISPRAWEHIQQRKPPIQAWYLDLRLLEQYYDGNHVYHHTPPTTLFYALQQGLALIEEEGLDNRWERHHRAHERLVAGLEKIGFVLPVSKDHRIWHLNPVTLPAGVDEAKFRQRLFNEFQIEVGPGLGVLAGKVVRIGIMGPLATDENVDYLLDAFKTCIS